MKHKLTLGLSGIFFASLLCFSTFSLAEVSAEEYFDVTGSVEPATEKSKVNRIFLIDENATKAVLDSEGRCFVVLEESLSPCTESQEYIVHALNKLVENHSLRRNIHSVATMTVGVGLFLASMTPFGALGRSLLVGGFSTNIATFAYGEHLHAEEIIDAINNLPSEIIEAIKENPYMATSIVIGLLGTALLVTPMAPAGTALIGVGAVSSIRVK